MQNTFKFHCYLIVVDTSVVPSLDTRATRNATAQKYVYLTNVVPGASASGQQNCMCAPVDSNPSSYGSVYDNVTRTIVVFSRKQVYHAYLVSFQ